MRKKYTPKQFFMNLDAIITGSTLTLCVVLVNFNVIMRYIFNSPLQWSEEVVTSLFVWTVFIGSAYAYRKQAHLGVDILVNLMAPPIRRRVNIIMSVIELLILIMLTYISAQYVYNLIYIRGEFKPVVTDILRIPKCFTGVAVPLGFGLSAIYSVYFMLTDRLGIIKKKAAGPEESHHVEGGNY